MSSEASLVAGALLAAGGCGRSDVVQVGSKKFTESAVLGEMLAQLARSTGASAEHLEQLGDTLLLWQGLLNGQLDAGTFSDPWATRILREGNVVPFDPGPMTDRFSIVIMAGTRLRQDDVALGRRYMLAYLRAIRDVQTDEQLKSDATVETFARWTGTSPDLVRSLQFMPRFDPNLTFDVDNLPTLIGTGDGAGGVIVPRSWGEHGLWRAAERLLEDPVRYAELSRAAYYRSRDYLPTTVAERFVKAVR